MTIIICCGLMFVAVSVVWQDWPRTTTREEQDHDTYCP
jgi:hypothetical protein